MALLNLISLNRNSDFFGRNTGRSSDDYRVFNSSKLNTSLYLYKCFQKSVLGDFPPSYLGRLHCLKLHLLVTCFQLIFSYGKKVNKIGICDCNCGTAPECSRGGGFLLKRDLSQTVSTFSLNLCVHTKSLQSCPTLCDPMDCSLPGASARGILQTRILEWVAMPSARGSSWSRDWTHISRVTCIGRWVLYH